MQIAYSYNFKTNKVKFKCHFQWGKKRKKNSINSLNISISNDNGLHSSGNFYFVNDTKLKLNNQTYELYGKF